MNTGKVFLGILAGLTAGALLGLLFAPKKEADYIRKITENEDDFKDKLDRKFDQFMEVINKKLNKATKDLSILAERK